MGRELPLLSELGTDLLQISWGQRLWTLLLPFLAMGGYWIFALNGWWVGALISMMVLSFATYGSTSHDLVHRSLGLPRGINDRLLRMIELLSFRSGTAYRLTHLHHHAHLLSPDDIEGSTAYGSVWKGIADGPFMQIRLWLWAWRRSPESRTQLAIEATGVVLLLIACLVCIPWTVVPCGYAVLAIGGSWFFPFITVTIPHNSSGDSELTKTRYFRGWISRLIAFDHLYHLEHHLYPAVPHHHWKRLADRLDPVFRDHGIAPVTGSRSSGRNDRESGAD